MNTNKEREDLSTCPFCGIDYLEACPECGFDGTFDEMPDEACAEYFDAMCPESERECPHPDPNTDCPMTCKECTNR